MSERSLLKRVRDKQRDDALYVDFDFAFDDFDFEYLNLCQTYSFDDEEEEITLEFN